MLKVFYASLLALLLICPARAAEPVWRTLDYAPAAADNPLKGLVPYASATGVDLFPHSMEFNYFPLSAVVKGIDDYDWSALESFLDQRARKGMQAVLRFYLEYPGKPSGMPEYLLKDGLELVRYQRKSTPPRPPVDILAPDYNNPALRSMLVKFIHAFGQKYDGDPRIGFITAGLLGHWGEWHSWPLADLFASKVVQNEVMTAYQSAFARTPILLRYPAGESDAVYQTNANRPFGYHDDSFGWSTLAQAGKSYHFMSLIERANAGEQWKAQPIGGEIRPEAFGKIFDPLPANSEMQDFRQCVEATHASWLMDSGMFRPGNSEERRQNALQQVRGMAYEYHASKVALALTSATQLSIALQVENRGVAPFYQNWPTEYALLNSRNQLVKTFRGQGKISGILPKEPAREWRNAFDLAGLPAGEYRVLLRIPNPLPNGKPLRFANTAQDADLAGWLTLGSVQLQ